MVPEFPGTAPYGYAHPYTKIIVDRHPDGHPPLGWHTVSISRSRVTLPASRKRRKSDYEHVANSSKSEPRRSTNKRTFRHKECIHHDPCAAPRQGDSESGDYRHEPFYADFADSAMERWHRLVQRRVGAIAHGYRAHAMVAAHSLVVAGFGRDDLYRLL